MEVASCGTEAKTVSPDPMGGRHEAEKGKVTKNVKHVKREGAAAQGQSGEGARASAEIRVPGDLFETGALRVSSLCTTTQHQLSACWSGKSICPRALLDHQYRCGGIRSYVGSHTQMLDMA